MTYEGSWLRRAIVFVLGVKVFALIVVVDFGQRALNPFDLPKSFASRSAEWVLVALLLMCFYRYGARIAPRSVIHFGVIALVVVSAMATLTATDGSLALY